MNFRMKPINNKSKLDNIDYLASEHVKDLQLSQYIKFESNVEKIKKHNQRIREASMNRETLGIDQDYKK